MLWRLGRSSVSVAALVELPSRRAAAVLLRAKSRAVRPAVILRVLSGQQTARTAASRARQCREPRSMRALEELWVRRKLLSLIETSKHFLETTYLNYTYVLYIGTSSSVSIAAIALPSPLRPLRAVGAPSWP